MWYEVCICKNSWLFYKCEVGFLCLANSYGKDCSSGRCWQTFMFSFWGSSSQFRTQQNRAKEQWQSLKYSPASCSSGGVSVHSAAFSWSHFPGLAHSPVSQSKYWATTASSDKEVHGFNYFLCFFLFLLNFAPSCSMRCLMGLMVERH